MCNAYIECMFVVKGSRHIYFPFWQWHFNQSVSFHFIARVNTIYKNISKFYFYSLYPRIMESLKVLSFLIRSGIFLILFSIFYAHYFLEVVQKFNAKNTYLALSQENIRSGKAMKSSCLLIYLTKAERGIFFPITH